MSLKWDFDYLWHFLAGGGFNGLVVWLMVWIGGAWWIPFIVVGLLFSGGILREGTQHKFKYSTHRWIEGTMWGVGGLIPALVGLGWLL